MNKKEIINEILELSDIHHNIRINYNLTPAYMGDNEEVEEWYSEDTIANDMVELFKEQFEDYGITKINDTGNRNLYEKCEIKGEIWQTGRMGATLYWDAYWNDNCSFKYNEEDLKEMLLEDLKEIHKDLKTFDKMVKSLMTNFYEECEFRLKNIIQEVEEREKEEKETEENYQKVLKIVKENNFQKRLLNEFLIN